MPRPEGTRAREQRGGDRQAGGRRRAPVGAVAALVLAASVSLAAEPSAPAGEAAAARVPLRIVITPTRVEQPAFEVPASVDVLGVDEIRHAQPQVNLSESLARVPGIVAQNRQNYAQDLQISSRGFGARSPFGVRGVRLLVDGIPLTSPDGQGQAATIDLATAERIEVLRGPFSALYGNSSGGVIAVYTEDPPPAFAADLDLGAGSYDASRFGLRFGDTFGDFGFLGHASRFQTDGYRAHSAARRDQWTTKLTYSPNASASLTLFATALHQPRGEDPGGLMRSEFEQNPRAAAPNAIALDTRKTIRHRQQGLVYQSRLGPGSTLRLLGYLGDRQVLQFLGVPPIFQQQPLHSGGVVDLDRTFGGLDARFTHEARLGAAPLTFTIGVAYDNQEERRRGFVNESGAIGALRRDEDDRVHAFDQYAQAQWRFAPRWSATAGIRHSEVEFEVTDFFVDPGSTPANLDDSGSVRFNETTPVAGLLYRLTPAVNLYANAGRGFETPTFAELAYRPDGGTGLNFDLRPATSANYEIGAKMFLGQAVRLNLALFYIETNDEIVPAENVDGRATFRNAGRTERRGAELVFESHLGAGFAAYLALAWVDAEYSDAFDSVPAGNRIPGVPEATAYGELSWRHAPRGFETALEARWNDRVYVNDANTESADAYTVVNWRAGFEQRIGAWSLREFVRVDNLLDRPYVGSVIVNASAGRFYEPAPERNYFLGASASYRF